MAQRSSSRGIAVIDTNGWKILEGSADRARIKSSLSLCGFGIWVSALNVLEVVRNENSHIRNRLLIVMRAVGGSQSVLPMPMTLLHEVGEALAKGLDGFVTRPTGLEWMLLHPESITDKHVAEAGRILDESQQRWDAAHAEARSLVRAVFERRGLRQPWPTIAEFLEQQWMQPASIEGYVADLWRELKLPEPAPIAKVLENETWRIFLEAMGASVFENAVATKTPGKVHQPDLLQLPYLTAGLPRMLVTEDRDLRRMAGGFIEGRYPSVRIISPQDLRRSAGVSDG